MEENCLRKFEAGHEIGRVGFINNFHFENN